MRLILVGPSHIPRIRHALEVVGLPKPAQTIIYLGDGGFPIWKKSVFDDCCRQYQSGDKIILIAADFRFGNSITKDLPANFEDASFFDGYTHVTRDLCTVKNDNLLKDLCVRSLHSWKSQFGSSLTILHWTLAMRTVKNRLGKQHVDETGKYLHPVWNISESSFSGEVAGLAAVQHAEDLSAYSNLTIDNDLHPSTLGYLYISAISVFGTHDKSLAAAKSIYMSGINHLTSELSRGIHPRTLLFGTSKLLQTIITALPFSSRKSLSEAGLDILNRGEQIDASLAEKYEKLVYLSDQALDSCQAVDSANNVLKRLTPIDENVRILYWEALATQVMQWRARNQRGVGTGLVENKLASEIYHTFWKKPSFEFDFKSINRLVEHGAGGSCTLWGVLTILTTSLDCNSFSIAEAALRSMSKTAKELQVYLD